MARDYTKFNIKGLSENLTKGNLVYEIVSNYAANKSLSFSELENAFPSQLQGSLGVVRKKSEIKDFKRFAKKSFKSSDGFEVFVCNQWGNNISGFIQRAIELGYQITKNESASISEGEGNKQIKTGETSRVDAYSFDINKLSLGDFKQLLRGDFEKEPFEQRLLKQVELNPDFWSYLLVYDYIQNEGIMNLSLQLIDDIRDVFIVEELDDITVACDSLATYVLDELELEFENVHLDSNSRILFTASFGTFLYFNLVNFATNDEFDTTDLAALLASNDHTMVRDGEEVFDSHNVGDDWIVDMADEWLLFCGFDTSDYYTPEVEVQLLDETWKESSIDYVRMAEDIIDQYA